MREGSFAQAQVLLEKLLLTEPEAEALYCLAVCQRKLADYQGALATLDRLIELDVDFSRAYQERGFLLRELNQIDQATAAFEHAVALNPALFASWRSLAGTKGYARSVEAGRQANWLQQLPPELLSVTSLLAQKQFDNAETLCKQFLKKQPSHPEAMRLLAAIAAKLQIYDDAEHLLEGALTLHPGYLRARLDYVEILHKRQKFNRSLDQANDLAKSDPNNPGFLLMLGNAQQACSDFEGALQSYAKARSLAPAHTPTDIALGNALKTIGQTKAAIEAYQHAIATRIDCGEAYWSLSNLKTYRFNNQQLADMHQVLDRPELPDSDRTHLCFALGKAYEDEQSYAESFKYYEQGNELRAVRSPYDAPRLARVLDYQREFFTAEFFAEHARVGHPGPDPIFIVGLPRSGSTLLEQILAAHSKVDGTMELSNIISMAHGFNAKRASSTPRPYPEVLNELTGDDLVELGQQYLTDTAHHRQGAPLFIDKMPNNFRHIALIRLILPNAKIIDARRDPMACCFSGYKQLFAEGQEFSYRQEDLAHYYTAYVNIMQHWDEALPGAVLRVENESLIANPEQQIRRMLDYCGLEFEEACLNFHQSDRAVRTPSSEQVRQPINSSAVNQWRNYRPYLSSLEEGLGALAPPRIRFLF